MTCKEIEGKLAPYQEGLLPPEERDIVETHLAACPQCSAALSDLVKTVGLIKGLPEVDPPPWFTQKVMAKVREEAGQKHGLIKRLFYPFHIKIPIEAFATLLVVMIGVYIYQLTSPETPTFIPPPPSVIQETVPPAGPIQELKKPSQKPAETQSGSDPAVPARKGSAYAPVPPSVERGVTKLEDRPPAEIPPTSSMDVEKSVERMGESPAPRHEALPSAIPRLRQKESIGAAVDSQQLKSAASELQAVRTVSLRVPDVQTGLQEVERILVRLGARNISITSRDNGSFVRANLNTDRTGDLLRQLGAVGTVHETETSAKPGGDSTLLRIEITGTDPYRQK